MRMPSKIAVDISEDNMGNIIAKPANIRYAKAFAKVRKENGGGSGDDAFFQEGGPAQEFLSDLSGKQRNELKKGYGITIKVDPWKVGHWYGYDAHTVAEGRSLRRRDYLTEAPADIILKQLGGGNRLKAMIGAKDIMSDNGGKTLVFKFPNKQRSKPNYIKITLTSADLYDLEFGRIGQKKDKDLAKMGMKMMMPSYKKLKTFKGVYNDMLMDIFEKETVN
jgi:hypothetical protein